MVFKLLCVTLLFLTQTGYSMHRHPMSCDRRNRVLEYIGRSMPAGSNESQSGPQASPSQYSSTEILMNFPLNQQNGPEEYKSNPIEKPTAASNSAS